MLRIVASEPTRTGTINLSLYAWMAPPRDSSSHGQTIAVFTAGLVDARAIKPREGRWRLFTMSWGTGSVDKRSFSKGAMSCAVPEKTDAPAPLLASQSNVTFFVESSLAVTSTLTKMRSPTRMSLWNASDTLVSEHPGPGRFVAKRPEMSEAHHMFGPVGSMLLTARSMSPSESRTAVNPEIEAQAIASSMVKTCSVLAVSPTEISSYVLFSINPRFIQIPSPFKCQPISSSHAIVRPRSAVQSDCNHVCQRSAYTKEKLYSRKLVLIPTNGEELNGRLDPIKRNLLFRLRF